jgi:shikimate dehydrogenase
MTAMRIDGATRLYAIVGHPIAQVKSPEVFSERFAAAGINALMLPVDVLPDRFETTMPALMGLANLDGLLVTVPYKPRAARFADRLGLTAGRIAAVNALRRDEDGRWAGDMFDGVGFVRAFANKGCEMLGRRVALFGAGGAGSAIACELATAGVASLAIIDPRRERADALAATIRQAFSGCAVDVVAEVPQGIDMIANASTVGMRADDGMPGEIGALGSDALVGDVIVSQEPTALIRHAIRHGCRHIVGREMVAGQADAIMAFLTQARG